jgi:hypothetical protein
MSSITARPFRQRIDEFIVGPSADARDRIWRDVRRDDFAKRRFDRTSAGEVVTAAGQRVARGTIANDSKVTTVIKLTEILRVDARGERRAAHWQHERRAKQKTAR